MGVSVAAGVSPPGIRAGSRAPCAIRESWVLSMNLPMEAIARVEQGSLTPTLSRGERVSRPALGDMPGFRSSEPSRIAPPDARPSHPKPAANILLLPPGEGRDEGRPLHSSLLGSWSQYVSNFWKTFLSMNLSVAVIARVETGSLTPPLSRGERVSHIPHGDMPELQPSEPSRPVPANTRPNPSKPAGNILPLPPGEGRGEGRSLHSSLHGSWSQYVSNFWKTFLPTNLPSSSYSYSSS
jgi:hypothetical protein